MLGNARSLRDEQGNPRGSLAAFIDITDRKETEGILKTARDNLEKRVEKRTNKLEKAYNSLKESECRRAEAQKMSHIGSWEWDIVTDKVHWSDELRRIFRCGSRKLDPSYIEYLSYVHPKDRDYVDNAFKETINRKLYTIDHRIILDNGEECTSTYKPKLFLMKKRSPLE